MNQKQFIRGVNEVASEYGAHVQCIQITKKHPRIILENDGYTRFVVHSATPSDVRAFHRVLMDVKRECIALQQLALGS